MAGLIFARYTLKGMEIQFHGGVMGHRGKNWKPGSEGDIKMLVVMVNPTPRCLKIWRRCNSSREINMFGHFKGLGWTTSMLFIF